MTSLLLIKTHQLGASFYLRIKMREFGSRVLGRELPFTSCADVVSCCFPRRDLGDQSCLIRDAAGDALSAENAEFTFGHIEPGSMFGGVVPLKAIRDAAGLFGGEILVQ